MNLALWLLVIFVVIVLLLDKIDLYLLFLGATVFLGFIGDCLLQIWAKVFRKLICPAHSGRTANAIFNVFVRSVFTPVAVLWQG